MSSAPRSDLPTIETLPGHLTRLALPILGEQLLIFSIDLFDVYLAGRLGAAETSAIGLAVYVAWMASLIFGLVRIGVAALVARNWGAGRFEEANRITARGIFLGAGLALFVWRVVTLAAPLFADSLKMNSAAHEIAVQFLRWGAIGQACTGLTMIMAAALRGTGDTRTPLAVLTLASVVNMLVAPACVFGFGPLLPLGVAGIVTATVTAQVTGLACMLAVITSGVTRLQPRLWEIRWERSAAARIVRIGTPAAAEGLLKFTGHYLFLMVIARLSPGEFSDAIFAAHIIGVRVEALSYLPAEAWGIASASLAGRLLGATSPDVALRTGHLALRQFLWFPIVMTGVFFFGARAIYGAMSADGHVADAGVAAFRLMALYQVPNACLIIYFQTLIGAGDTRFPMWCSLMGSLCIRVPMAYLCGVVLHGGLFGAWIGMGVDNLIRAGLISWRYAAGRWTQLKV